MAVLDEETKKAWEALTQNKKEEKSEKKTEENKEKKSEKEEEKTEQEEEKAAVWLTQGELEREVSDFTTPVLHMSQNVQPVSSLEDFAGPERKKEEKKSFEMRPYETESKAYLKKEEAYEESAENLFGRMIKPMDARELRQELPRIRMHSGDDFGEGQGISIRSLENRPESPSLPFMSQEKREDIRKYKKNHSTH